MVMADRIALMNNGSVVQLASPRELYRQPASMFAADFIGISSFIHGTYRAGSLRTSNQGVLRVTSDQSLAENTGAAIALRPEHIVISEQNKLPHHNAVQGEISAVAFRGQDLNLLVDVADCAAPLVVRLASMQSDGAADIDARDYQPGQTIWCNWLPEHGRLLPSP